jgi:hypothetical protein
VSAFGCGCAGVNGPGAHSSSASVAECGSLSAKKTPESCLDTVARALLLRFVRVLVVVHMMTGFKEVVEWPQPRKM